jgi:hypothetical protein
MKQHNKLKENCEHAFDRVTHQDLSSTFLVGCLSFIPELLGTMRVRSEAVAVSLINQHVRLAGGWY